MKTIVGTLPPLSAVSYLSLSQALDSVPPASRSVSYLSTRSNRKAPPSKTAAIRCDGPCCSCRRKKPNPLVEAFIHSPCPRPVTNRFGHVYSLKDQVVIGKEA